MLLPKRRQNLLIKEEVKAPESKKFDSFYTEVTAQSTAVYSFEHALSFSNVKSNLKPLSSRFLIRGAGYFYCYTVQNARTTANRLQLKTAAGARWGVEAARQSPAAAVSECYATSNSDFAHLQCSTHKPCHKALLSQCSQYGTTLCRLLLQCVQQVHLQMVLLTCIIALDFLPGIWSSEARWGRQSPFRSKV